MIQLIAEPLSILQIQFSEIMRLPEEERQEEFIVAVMVMLIHRNLLLLIRVLQSMKKWRCLLIMPEETAIIP